MGSQSPIRGAMGGVAPHLRLSFETNIASFIK
jgi:hypothetical protein